MVKLSLPLWLKMQKHCLKTMISLRDPTQNKFHLFTTKVLYMWPPFSWSIYIISRLIIHLTATYNYRGFLPYATFGT